LLKLINLKNLFMLSPRRMAALIKIRPTNKNILVCSGLIFIRLLYFFIIAKTLKCTGHFLISGTKQLCSGYWDRFISATRIFSPFPLPFPAPHFAFLFLFSLLTAHFHFELVLFPIFEYSPLP